MSKPTLTCKDEQRRYDVQAAENLNGLDYLEVEIQEQSYYLCVHFLGPVPSAPEQIDVANIRIDGGQRIRDIKVKKLESPEPGSTENCLKVKVDKLGDFSTYTLRLVDLDPQKLNIDPRYAQLPIHFRASCPSDLDCKQQPICPPEEHIEPEINYLAKDYASFRQLILDRLALLMPDWQERHVPDLGITLVELLGYVGDRLSYYQDAVATEAYLDTARQRISVRRHSRLIDYPMHEGCNARTWVWLETSQNMLLKLKNFYFITCYPNAPTSGIILSDEDIKNIPLSFYEVFEPWLEDSEPMSQFQLSDFRDLPSLAAQLQDPRDSLSRYLREQLSESTQRLLDEYPSIGNLLESLQKALVDELNYLIWRISLYDEQRFAHIELTDQTRELIKQNLQGKELMRLNRLLLEEAYPREIKSISKFYLYKAHNKIYFYTWGDRQCCLPKGATTAILRDEWVKPSASQTSQPSEQSEQADPDKKSEGQEILKLERQLHLKPGDILIFEEVKGAKTGSSADADPTRRHTVRLTKVELREDPLYQEEFRDSDRQEEPKTETVAQKLPIPLLEIEWTVEDALPFPLCISAIGPAPECKLISDISVARGNVLLADHGRTLAAEDLGIVPEKNAIASCEGEGQPADIIIEPASFRPSLKQASLTFRQPLSAEELAEAPASRLLAQSPRKALPQITMLVGLPSDEPLNLEFPPEHLQWKVQRDLLGSNSLEQHFVVEMNNEGQAHLRFGDGELGRQPAADTHFFATYRVGNAPQGNIGAETLSHIVFRGAPPSGITLQPHNPFPAQGGTLPEPLSDVKLYAPHAFRKDLQRAITAQDYADIVMRDFPDRVQCSAATLRWTGSWYEVLVAIDPSGTETVKEKLLEEIDQHLYRYRRMGHDVVVKPAIYVPLNIAMNVCVEPDYLRGHIKSALLEIFSNRILLNGRRGFFHPDNLTFGIGVALSHLVATAQAVPGVANVKVTRLQRFGEEDNGELESGILPLSSLEIARLDNDPNFPENGKFELTMGGGR